MINSKMLSKSTGKKSKCKHAKAYKTSFGYLYCPECERNV